MTTDLIQDFSLEHTYDWDKPMGEAVQLSIAAYGSDEDRLKLVEHFSVSIDSLDTMSIVPSAEVRQAVAGHPLTTIEVLVRLTRDQSKFVRAAAKHAIDELPEKHKATARTFDLSPLQRLRARRTA